MEPEVLVIRHCPYCRKTYALHLENSSEFNAYILWVEGVKKIQEAFPEWTPAMREQMQTGYHPECWHKAFGEPGDN